MPVLGITVQLLPNQIVVSTLVVTAAGIGVLVGLLRSRVRGAPRGQRVQDAEDLGLIMGVSALVLTLALAVSQGVS